MIKTSATNTLTILMPVAFHQKFSFKIWPVPGISFSKSVIINLKKFKTLLSLYRNIFTSLNLNYSNQNTEKKDIEQHYEIYFKDLI